MRDNGVSTRYVSGIPGDPWTAYERLPRSVREALQLALQDWCPLAVTRQWLNIWRLAREVGMAEDHAARLYVAQFHKSEEAETVLFSQSYKREHQTHTPHVAARATVLRHMPPGRRMPALLLRRRLVQPDRDQVVGKPGVHEQEGQRRQHEAPPHPAPGDQQPDAHDHRRLASQGEEAGGSPVGADPTPGSGRPVVAREPVRSIAGEIAGPAQCIVPPLISQTAGSG